MDNKSSFRSIIKATGLFGGTQIVLIVVQLIKNKMIAVLLGTTGFGIIGLLNAPINYISTLSGLGLSFTTVRDIAEANESGDKERIAKKVISLKRLMIITGSFGLIITLLASHHISVLTFGNSDYTVSFMILSLTLVINSFADVQKVILQGLRKLKLLAKASIAGAFLGLIFVIPLYYLLQTDGIVIAILLTSIVSLAVFSFFTYKIRLDKPKVSLRETIEDSRKMLKLGFTMSVSSQIGSLSALAIATAISRFGGVDQVGLFNAARSLLSQSVGIVLTAMGTDYYPRLAGVNTEEEKVTNLVNQQALVTLLLLGPIVLILMISFPMIVTVLLSEQFHGIIEYLNIATLGILFQGIAWSLGYISFAKGDSKVFFLLEGVASNILNVTLSGFGYYLGGLFGIGLASTIYYFVYMMLVYTVAKKKYNFDFSRDVLLYLVVHLILVIAAYLSLGQNSYFRFILVFSFFLMSLTISLFKLNQLIELKDLVLSVMQKIKVSKD